jgi:ribosomal-protein-alanine N-acetyltransferase
MILRATPAHADALAHIHAASFPQGQRWGPDAMALHMALPGCFALLDARGGMAIARVAADEAELLTLAVLPESRRQGLARALLDEAERHAAAHGAAAMFLEVATRNTAAQALYAAAGYHQAGRRRRYYADGDDALVLRKSLAAT